MNLAKLTWSYSLLSCALVFSALTSNAQTIPFWADDFENIQPIKGERQIVPDHYRYVSLDIAALEQHLTDVPKGNAFDARSSSTLLEIPTPDGNSAAFQVLEASIMHPDLQAKFPGIRTYAGQGVDDPSLTIRFDVTPKGFHAMILGHDQGAIYVDPYHVNTRSNYISYYKKDYKKKAHKNFIGCHYTDVNDPEMINPTEMIKGLKDAGTRQVGDCQLRTYRLALACTGEYANFHGSNTTNNDKSFAAAAMVTSMNRVNGIYEAEATLTMVLVPGNDALIFLDAGADPYTNADGSAMLGQNQTTCNNVIGSANYDIGHVFSTGGGGVAFLRSPCGGNKAGGG